MDDFSAIAMELADVIAGDDAADYRVIPHIGDSRSKAMEGKSADPSDAIAFAKIDDAGSLRRDEIGAHIYDMITGLVQKHATGPVQWLYLVVRKTGKTGNVAVSKAIALGSEIGRDRAGDMALANAVSIIPKTFDILSGLLRHAMTEGTHARQAERDVSVAFAEAMGRSEASDDGARWQAMAEAAGQLAPTLQEAVRAWAGAQDTRQASDTTAEDILQTLDGMPPEEVRRVVSAILAHQAAQGGE